VVSSPWLLSAETCISEVLWLQVTAVWTEKQKWLGCRKLAEEVDKTWGKAKHCLSACKKLGKARTMTPNQLRNCAGTWHPRDDLTHQNCTLTADEYAAVVMGLIRLVISTMLNPQKSSMTLPQHLTKPSLQYHHCEERTLVSCLHVSTAV
jgi:hypothetical protein